MSKSCDRITFKLRSNCLFCCWEGIHMYYTNIIRIQTSINMKSLNEISNSMDYLKLQLNISNLQKAMLPLCN